MTWEWLIILLYGLSLLFIFFFSLGQLHLTFHYLKAKKKQKKSVVQTPEMKSDFPKVCVQLPIFNEKYVVNRLVDAVCKLDYPNELLEIQLLDDSTDETTEILEAKTQYWQSKGKNIQLIRRPERVDFKAGALKYGMEITDAEFIAIFDADFLPQAHFLKATIPHFQNEKVGVVQTRWGHVNKDYSLLTRLQAFGLDAHFTVEQVGRNTAGSFINFNGTGGVWRKETIIDAGGWSADTLTEDLDLSYRAQLKGWTIHYFADVGAPAELPAEIHGLKSQQYRWMKGGAETAKLLLSPLWQSSQKLSIKIQGTAHLLTSSIFVAIVLATIFSIPASYAGLQLPKEIPLGLISFLALIGLSANYFIANLNHAQLKGNIWVRFIKLLLF
ncbi:MAG: histidine kinase, partial [Bacteroidetes bacterium]